MIKKMHIYSEYLLRKILQFNAHFNNYEKTKCQTVVYKLKKILSLFIILSVKILPPKTDRQILAIKRWLTASGKT